MTTQSELAALDAAATQGEWGIWREPIADRDAAISELADQVQHTDPMIDAMILLDAGGKCPAITGCGPTADANADLIVALVNLYRSGKLVMVPSVESVAAVISEADGATATDADIARAVLTSMGAKHD